MFNRILKLAIKIFVFVFLLVSVLPYAVKESVEEEFNKSMLYDNSEFINIDEHSIHYRVWEPKTEVKGYVLLVHGFGSSTYSWRHSAPNLAELGYCTVALDLPGFGYSDRLAIDYNNSKMNYFISEFLIAWEDRVGTSDLKWNIVGHSLGGTIASNYARAYGNVNKLVIVDGVLFKDGKSVVKNILKYPPAKRWAKQIIGKLYFTEKKISEILEEAYGRRPSKDEVTEYLRPLLIEGSVNSYISFLENDISISIDEVKDIDVPIYAIWGEEDSTTPISFMNTLKKVKEGVDTYVILDSAHCPMETNPTEFNIMMETILK